MPTLTYPEVGATRTGVLPPGYRHVRHRVRLGRNCFGTAADAVLGWRLHQAAGVRIEAAESHAVPGILVRTGLGLGPLRLWAPCEVVWVEQGSDRAGFGYGTLPGHPARGEEAFVVERDSAGEVWFSVLAFSRPGSWLMRLAGPAARLFQWGYAWWLGRALRRLTRRS